MGYIKYLILLFLLTCLCCKEKDRKEIEKREDYTIEKIMKNDTLISSKTYKNRKLIWEFFYKNNVINKVVEYYPNKKVKSTSTLIQEPNHYNDISYYENGTIEKEGESDYIKSKGYKLRRGGTIFYTKNGNIYAMMNFLNDGKREYLTRETQLDTITRKIIKDVKYAPPLLVK